MTEPRTICIEKDSTTPITYMEQPDGTWVNLYSERTFDAAFMHYHFPWAFGEQHNECTCVERPNDYGPRCPACRANAYLSAQRGDNLLCGGQYTTEVDF